MSKTKVFTNATGEPVADNTNITTAGSRGPTLPQTSGITRAAASLASRGSKYASVANGFVAMILNLPCSHIMLSFPAGLKTSTVI